MPDLYWVGGSATWNATAGTKWALTSGGVGGLGPPTASDNTFFDANSGASTVTVSGNAATLNLSFANFTGTLVDSGVTTITVSGSLVLGAGMTNTYTDVITMNATSGTQTITSNGKAFAGGLTLNGVGGTFQLVDTFSSVNNISLTNGVFDSASQTITCTSLNSSNSNVRSILLGTSTINFISGGGWSTSTATNLTLDASTSTINLTDASSATKGFAGTTSQTFGTINVTAGTGAVTNLTIGTVTNLSFAGFLGDYSGANTFSILGNLTLGAGMTVGVQTGTITFAATSGTKTITSNNVTLGRTVTFDGVGGTWQLADAFSVEGTKTVTLTNGTFNAANQNVTVGKWASNNSNTRTITMGTGTWTLTSTGTVWTTLTTTGLTLTPNTSTIVINDASASSKSFSGGGATFANFYFTGAGSGVCIILGSNTFADFKVDTAPKTVNITASTTQTVTSFTATGDASNLITFQSVTAGTFWSISKASGVVTCNYLSLKDSHAIGGASFYAGGGSTNVSGNSGWVFTSNFTPQVIN